MSQKFQATIERRHDLTLVKLSGVIDEDNQLVDLVDQIPSGTVELDLGEVDRINSWGVRDWVNWLRKIEAKPVSTVLVKCSPAIVAQVNLVRDFAGKGLIKSFYVPYLCPDCDKEKVLLVEASQMGPPPFEPPPCECDDCDIPMEFDDMPELYFAFLAEQKNLA